MEGIDAQNYLERVGRPRFDGCLSTSRVILGKDALAGQKNVVLPARLLVDIHVRGRPQRRDETARHAA